MGGAWAETYYVSPAGSHQAPYADWLTAATNIQAAIDAATDGDTVLVTNGNYRTGGGVVHGSLTNRIAIRQALTVRSVNGPGATVILGSESGTDTPVRCAYVGDGARLEGFTLTGGRTRISGGLNTQQSGGGVWCELTAVVANCTLAGNTAEHLGGGSYGGTMLNCTFSGNAAKYGGGSHGGTVRGCTISENSAVNGGGTYGGQVEDCTLAGNTAAQGGGSYGGTILNCVLTGNTSAQGGGAYESLVQNCLLTGNAATHGGGTYLGQSINSTLSGNAATIGGGTYQGTVLNSIVYGNSASVSDANCKADGEGSVAYTCTTPDPGGAGNLTAPPQFVGGSPAGFRLSIESPCIDAGTNQAWMVGATDLDGNPRREGGRVDLGCYEFTTRTHYVSPSGSAQPPYITWDTAATTIQDAVDEAIDGDTVLVSEGTYGSGGVAMDGGPTNRVAITNAITVRSVSGPGATTIRGDGPLGVAAVRCVYVGDEARLEGFTLTNGHTHSTFTGSGNQLHGGGAYCKPSAVLSNCVLSGNAAHTGGGGAYGGTIQDCTLSNNSSANGGGAAFATLQGCTLSGNSAVNGGGVYEGASVGCTLSGNSAANGGGTYQGLVQDCTLSGNSALNGGGTAFGIVQRCRLSGNASSDGGGAFGGTVQNCLVTANAAVRGGGMAFGSLRNSRVWGNSADDGGGTYLSTLEGCTVSGNSARHRGGGTYQGTVTSSIVYYNSAGQDAANGFDSVFEYSCTTPDPGGVGNVSGAPEFEASGTDVHLRSTSPCVDTGSNLTWMVDGTDLDGNPRIQNGRVDMGCYERKDSDGDGIDDEWELRYFPNVATVSFESDFDQDGFRDGFEFHAGTNPTNAASSLQITSMTLNTAGTEATFRWSSVSNKQYALYGQSDLIEGQRMLLHRHIPADPPENVFTSRVDGVDVGFYGVTVETQP